MHRYQLHHQVYPFSCDGSNAMNGKVAVLLLFGSLAACVPVPPPQASAPTPAPAAAPAPAPTSALTPGIQSAPADRIVVIRRADCATLLGLPQEDRAAAAMFYFGYQAGRHGARTINVGSLAGMEALAFSYCVEHPDRPVVEAFAHAYRPRARR
jgi:hypothetical protein